jgi:hypothetical protein
MRTLLLVLSLIPVIGFSQVISQVSLEKSGDGHISSVLLKGSGFGVRVVPVFYDQVGVAYEKGIPNYFFNTFSAERQITQADTVKNLASPWQNVHGSLFVQADPKFMRSAQSGKYYYGSAIHSHIHNPRVHSRSGTPVEAKKIYVSWWFRQQNETRNYFQHELSTIDGGFNPVEGDEFVVDVGMDWTGISKIYGRVIAYYPETKILHANYYGQNNANRINGKRLTLDKNGKGALLAVYTRGTGSNKYLRVWESDGTDGTFRSSWTNTEVYQGDFRKVQRSNVIPQQWNHMEYFADQERKYIKTKINGVVDAEGYYTVGSDVAGYSPTIGLIGLDSNQPEMLQKIWMDDIYLNTSFRRITLGNAPKHSDVTHEEVQFYDQWIDTEIKFTPYYGSLDRKNPAYIYIYSEDDVPNEDGISFESPPLMEQ